MWFQALARKDGFWTKESSILHAHLFLLDGYAPLPPTPRFFIWIHDRSQSMDKNQLHKCVRAKTIQRIILIVWVGLYNPSADRYIVSQHQKNRAHRFLGCYVFCWCSRFWCVTAQPATISSTMIRLFLCVFLALAGRVLFRYSKSRCANKNNKKNCAHTHSVTRWNCHQCWAMACMPNEENANDGADGTCACASRVFVTYASHPGQASFNRIILPTHAWYEQKVLCAVWELPWRARGSLHCAIISKYREICELFSVWDLYGAYSENTSDNT